MLDFLQHTQPVTVTNRSFVQVENHFKGDVGMSGHEKQENAYTKTQKLIHNPIPTSAPSEYL